MNLFQRKRKATDTSPISGDERVMIGRFVHDGDIVFDIGAHTGDWTKEVLSVCGDAKVFAFEAAPATFEKFRQRLETEDIFRDVTAQQLAVSNGKKEIGFHHYPEAPYFSTAHRRLSVEGTAIKTTPIHVRVPAVSVDGYCEEHGIARINYLKIDVEGAEYDVLRGCGKMLRSGAVDYVQFEYGGTFIDAGITLRLVASYLKRCGYLLYRVRNGKFARLESARDLADDFKFANLLAVNRRLAGTVEKSPPKQAYDIFQSLSAYRVTPRGVLHVGAHQGNEIATYDRAGVAKVTFVEANPVLAEKLRERFADRKDIGIVGKAISDKQGVLPFHITTMDQSSSLLPLHKHKEIYPKIRHAETIEVEATTLDALLGDGTLAEGDFNVLVLDIQGAELMALKGAAVFLRGIEAIHTEVNFDELYKEGADIHALDKFLEEQGFIRVRTVTPSHATWGDALYVRPPKVTVSNLGTRGRYGNHIFQYMFLRTYAKDRGYVAETPDWIGRYLFGADDPLLSDPSLYREVKQDGLTLADCHIVNATEDMPFADFNGFFQYRTNYYEPHKDFIRTLFRPSDEVREALAGAKQAFDALQGPVAGVHIRRGDYGYGHFFLAPEEWYLDWLEEYGKGEPVTVFLASDEPDRVRGAFGKHRVVTCADLGAELPKVPHYPDFHFLSQCDALATSNSSFSFVAAMLNEKADAFMRPDLGQKKLIAFDPWDAEPLLTNAMAEDHGSAFMHPRRSAKLKNRLRRALGMIPK